MDEGRVKGEGRGGQAGKEPAKEDKTILGNQGNEGVMWMLCSEVGYFTVMFPKLTNVLLKD